MSNPRQQQRSSGLPLPLLAIGAGIVAWLTAPRHVEKAVNLGTSSARSVIEQIPDDGYGVKEQLLKVPSLVDKAASMANDIHAKFIKQEQDVASLKAKVALEAEKVAAHRKEWDAKLASLKELKATEAKADEDDRKLHAEEIKKLEAQLAKVKADFAKSEAEHKRAREAHAKALDDETKKVQKEVDKEEAQRKKDEADLAKKEADLKKKLKQEEDKVIAAAKREEEAKAAAEKKAKEEKIAAEAEAKKKAEEEKKAKEAVEKKAKEEKSALAEWDGAQNVVFKLRAHNLPKEDIVGTSDPFIRILKHDKTDGGRWQIVYETKHLADTTDPDFPTFSVKKDKLVNSFMDDEILIQVYDYDVAKQPDLIGEFKSTLHQLAGKGTFGLFHPDRNKKAGILEVESVEVK